MSEILHKTAQLRRGTEPPRRLIGMSFRLGIPRPVALQQSLPPLSQPGPLCNDNGWSVEQFSANRTCLTNGVSQKGPQSTKLLSLAADELLVLLQPQRDRSDGDLQTDTNLHWQLAAVIGQPHVQMRAAAE
jgi:hypothetical protein